MCGYGVEESRESDDGLNVDLDGSWGEVAEGHVLDHAMV
jgi:hypothetical protein